MKTFGIGYIVTVLMVYFSSTERISEEFSCDHNATKYICTMPFEKLDIPQTYILYHVYNIEPFIAAHIRTSPTNTKLIMELESFDNNTSVNVVKLRNKNDVWSNKIILTAKDVVKDKIVGRLYYFESTDIQFSCEEYAPRAQFNEVFTVLINNKENKIEVLSEKKRYKNRIKMKDNGSILCCMYYSYEWTADWEDLQITRYVVKKMLLIYQPKDNSAGSSTTTTTKTDEVQTIESSTMTNANNVKTSNSTVTVVSTLCGIAFTVLVTFVIWKRCCSTQSPQGTRGLPTPTHEPFYLNMLFRRECDQEIAEIEAHTYEEIGP